MSRPILHLRRLFRLIPKLLRHIGNLEFTISKLEKLSPLLLRLQEAECQIRELQLSAAERLIPKLECLDSILPKLSALGNQVPELEILGQIVPKFEQLDAALAKLGELGKPVPLAVVPVVDQSKNGSKFDHEWNRLKMLGKFVQLAGKAKEVESEWQRIQQEEFDAVFAAQLTGRKDDELLFVYKKGVTEGIKWCVNRFC